MINFRIGSIPIAFMFQFKFNLYDNFLLLQLSNFFFWSLIVIVKFKISLKNYFFFIFFWIALEVPRVNLTYIKKDLFFNKIFFLHIFFLFLAFSNILSLICINFVYILLILGCFWSYNEILWNGYWNWNFIEYFNLIFFIFFLVICHKNNCLLKYNLIGAVILFFIVINHYPLIISVHNFINNNLLNYSVFLVLIFFFVKNHVYNLLMLLYSMFYFYNFNIVLIFKLYLLNFFF